MTPQIRQIMLDAGYAAPELAGRAQILAQAMVDAAIDSIKEDMAFTAVNPDEWRFGYDAGREQAIGLIKLRFGIDPQ